MTASVPLDRCLGCAAGDRARHRCMGEFATLVGAGQLGNTGLRTALCLCLCRPPADSIARGLTVPDPRG